MGLHVVMFINALIAAYVFDSTDLFLSNKAERSQKSRVKKSLIVFLLYFCTLIFIVDFHNFLPGTIQVILFKAFDVIVTAVFNIGLFIFFIKLYQRVKESK